MKAKLKAILSKISGEPIATVHTDSREVDLAGAIALDGAPVNVQTCKTSGAKRYLEKLHPLAPIATRHEYKHGGGTWVFYTIED